ncbi:Interleukin-12 receptor subunit beta-1 [Channa argus]|uniref:Interleukin-12 receptor subunit beta-1 n=1 Tax=Channa argus TaxID=215402 RepID=A0A6G1PLA8_CHAAH|nr:Interleukin-12 receptor subunit beta-1 [Channa argus]KAK2908010.1 hypothetical protein Q8A73_009083 [Channa argus]
METLKCWSLLNGYIVMFMFLTDVGTGSACDAPSSPQCFRKNADDSVYMCEWSMNTTEGNVTFDIYFNENKFERYKETRCIINEEKLIKHQPVDIWVKAHIGNSSCASPRTSVVLEHTIKYEPPRHILVSWLKNNLSLTWAAADKHQALAEIWLQQDKLLTVPWDKRLTNTTYSSLQNQVIVGNLLKHSAYHVKIRQRSTLAQNPLWSNWSEFTVPAGSACETLSNPQCFRKKAEDSVYICEWSMSMTETNVIFDIYLNTNKLGSYKETRCTLNEEQLIKYRTVDIWVKAHVRNFSCASPRTSVVLEQTIKYEAPRHISVSWIKNNLSLIWTAAEEHPALAEIWFRRAVHLTGPWEKRLANTTYKTLKNQVIVGNLLKHSAYQVQIRQRSTQAQNPLWSNWSEVTVPAELEHEPKVTVTITHLNGTRMVTLTWKPMPHAAAVTGVTYILEDTLSQGCTCGKEKHPIVTKNHTASMYVAYSAVNISIFARNTVGVSPPAVIQVPSKPAAELKICDDVVLKELNNASCHEWWEFQDGDTRSKNVMTVSRKRKKPKYKITNDMRDYVRYLYFEQTCYKRKLQTVKMCIFYKKQGVPHKEPGDLIAFGETETSVELSWKAIPLVEQQGHLTHYSLCSIKINSLEQEDCHNISAQWLKYHLENLTPESKYNISLAGVTEVGQGPKATVTIKTLPEKPLNVWLSFGLLFGFFLMSTMGTVVLKRIKSKILPPVPVPVIPDFIPHQLDSQEMLEEKEEVDELMLLQPHPEVMPVSEDAEESSVLPMDWSDSSDEDMENDRGDTKMSGGTSHGDDDPNSTDQILRNSGDITNLEQVDNEITMLMYRNGLVFDVKTDSP